MSMSDYPLVQQLHADRTARLQREHRRLRLPTFRSIRFTRKEQRLAIARVAPTC